MFDGRPWRWYQSALPAWKAKMEQMGLGERIIHGSEVTFGFL